MLPDVFRADARIRAFIPGHFECIEALFRGPHVIADDGDQIVQYDDLLHARDLPGGAVIDLADLAAEHRAGRERGELHAGQHRVDAVDRLAVGLVGRIKALQRRADQREILGILERHVLGRGLAARRKRQRAIGKLASALAMRDLAIRCLAATGLDLPLLGCGLYQHGARTGAGIAQRLPERPDRIGIAGDLKPERRIAVKLVVRRRVLQRDLPEVGVEFFGQYHRDRSIDALSHLDLRHHQRCMARCVDADEGVRCELAVGRVGRLYRLVDGANGKVEGEQEPARQTAGQQRAA